MKLTLHNKNIRIGLMGVGMLLCSSLSSQKLALKSNFVAWGTMTPNAGIEVVLNSHISASLMLNYHPFDYNNKPFKFFLAQPELRYWPGRPNARHFFALSTFYFDNHIQYKQTYYKGNGIATGILYGYDWVLNRRWNIEASLGVGAMHARQFKYKEGEQMPSHINYEKWLFVPVQCSISFVYLIQ